MKKLLLSLIFLGFTGSAFPGGQVVRNQGASQIERDAEWVKNKEEATALRLLDAYILQQGYKTENPFVKSVNDAESYVNTFPHLEVRRILQSFVETFKAGKLPPPLFPKCLTLIGDPGIGKTTIGYAVGELIPGSRTIEITGHHLLNTYKESCRGLIHGIFSKFHTVRNPVIIIVDDFDKTIAKTHTKDFHDKEFLSQFMRALDQLPPNVLVILTGNNEFDFNIDEAFAENRLKDTCYFLGKAVDQQRRQAIARHVAMNAEVVNISDDEITQLVKVFQGLSLRDIDRLFTKAFLNKTADSPQLTYLDLKNAVQLVQDLNKPFYVRWCRELRTNQQLRYFLVGVGVAFACVGINLLYQYYIAEPINAHRHAESLTQGKIQHQAWLDQQAMHHAESCAQRRLFSGGSNWGSRTYYFQNA